jgi:arabinose operon protein AraL
MIDQIDGFIIDLDGTVYRGEEMIEGAAETIAYLKSKNKKIVFLSNRGNISRKMCHNKLLEMGLQLPEEEILLSSTVTARYLAEEQPGSKVWVLGGEGLADELRIARLEVATVPEQADWLVITLHETLTYHDLNLAFRAVRNGAQIIATNSDKTFPRDDGDCIDVAGMIGAITASTGREVEVVIGKPSLLMAKAACDALGVQPERCLVIGDSVESDIALGQASGMKTALVLSGSTKKDQLSSIERKPDFVWDSLVEVKQIF